MELGNMVDARIDFDQALKNLKDPVTALTSILGLDRVTNPNDPNLVALLKVAEEKEDRDSRRYVPVHYAIGKAFEDLRLFDDAFEHFAKGAAIKRGQISYDADQVSARIDGIIDYFTAERIAALRAHASQDNSVIMVVGMPRSGTTLTETIIASHSRVEGGGERPELMQLFPPDVDGRYAYPSLLPTLTDERIAAELLKYPKLLGQRANGAAFVSDKMPPNFQYLGLVHALLPNVKIVLTKRDPVDICVSLFTRLFDRAQYQSYDLVELGRYYKDYHRLMAHWRQVLPADAFYESQYEELVSDFDNNARRLIDHVGLDWEDACATPHKNKRSVKTASVTQVREPVYTRSVRKWVSYRDHIGPLLETLGDLVEQ
jgi:tetratricopeptide (TPR) repeat protein